MNINDILFRIAKCKRWIHKNGRIYEVMYIANIDAKETQRDEYPLMIVYKDDNGVIWSKTPETFIRSRTEYYKTTQQSADKACNDKKIMIDI